MKQDARQRWILALRYGPYWNESNSSLMYIREGRSYFSALGVLVDQFLHDNLVPAEVKRGCVWMEWVKDSAGRTYYISAGQLTVLPYQVKQWAGTEEGEFGTTVSVKGSLIHSVREAQDIGMDLHDIADLIEQRVTIDL